MKYTIAFRVDASHKIGSGHAMRCLTLAEALKKMGIFSIFITRENLSAIATLTTTHGIPLINLEASPSNVSPPESLMHGDFLACGQLEDAQATLSILASWPDVRAIIVDHYGIYRPWDEIIAHKYKIFKIDDLADREHLCKGLLDQNFYLDQDVRYKRLLPEDALQLLGPRHALLRSIFLDVDIEFRRHRLLKNILISFGGHDREGYSLKVAKDLLLSTEFIIQIMGTVNPKDQEEWEELRRKFPKRLLGPRYFDNPTEPMLWADFYIGAGGTTTWERFACGLPGLVYSIATNQIKMAQDLDLAGFQPYGGAIATYRGDHLQSKLEQFLDPSMRWEAAQRMRALVDGHGADRVIDAWRLNQS